MTWAEFKNQISVFHRNEVLSNPKSPQYMPLVLSFQKRAARLRQLEI